MTRKPRRQGHMTLADKYMVFVFTPFSLAIIACAFHLQGYVGEHGPFLPMMYVLGAQFIATALGVGLMTRESIMRGDAPPPRRKRPTTVIIEVRID